MSNRKYFGTDGIRGRVGDAPITPDFVLKLGWAAGKVLARHGSRKISIGKDTRISGYMLESALEAGLAAAGLSALFTGPMPTPAVAYLTRTFRERHAYFWLYAGVSTGSGSGGSGPFRTLHWPDANTGRGLSDAYLPRRGRNCDICIA